MPSFGSKFLACLLLSSAILVSGQFEHYLDSLQPSELYEFEEGSLGSIHYLPKGDNKTFELQREPDLRNGCGYACRLGYICVEGNRSSLLSRRFTVACVGEFWGARATERHVPASS